MTKNKTEAQKIEQTKKDMILTLQFENEEQTKKEELKQIELEKIEAKKIELQLIKAVENTKNITAKNKPITTKKIQEAIKKINLELSVDHEGYKKTYYSVWDKIEKKYIYHTTKASELKKWYYDIIN